MKQRFVAVPYDKDMEQFAERLAAAVDAFLAAREATLAAKTRLVIH